MKRIVSILTVCALGLPLVAATGCGSDAKSDKKKEKKSDDEDESESRPKLSSAELTEAKNTIGAITRAAVGAYERERISEVEPAEPKAVHALCKTAAPAPSKLPSKKEKVETTDADWGGDENTGWKCLKFSVTNPVRFQFSYIAGSGYKGKGRVTDPGPDGFQVCAEADADPGGDTTLICMTGTVSKTTDTVKIATEMETRPE